MPKIPLTVNKDNPKNRKPNHLEWLRVIISSRLIFNTLDEYADYLENKNLKNNSLKSIYNTEFKQRAVFNDFKVYIHKMTNGYIDLEKLMYEYKEASDYYKKHLSRRVDKEKLAKNILDIEFNRVTFESRKELIDNKDTAFAVEISCLDINMYMVILLFLNLLPCYKSKGKDTADDFYRNYYKVIDMVKDVTSNSLIYDVLPEIEQAANDSEKSIIKLLWHLDKIYLAYRKHVCNNEFYNEASLTKNRRWNWDLSGFWTTDNCNLSTDFWVVLKTNEKGVFNFSHCKKTSENKIISSSYTAQLLLGDSDDMIIEVNTPNFIRHITEGSKIGKEDQVSYVMEEPIDTTNINQINLNQKYRNTSWPKKINLTKVTDDNITKTYLSWIESLKIEEKFDVLDYEVNEFCLAAMTKSAVYIDGEKSGTYYRIPIDLVKNMTKLNMESSVERIKYKGRLYIYFWEFDLCIKEEDFAEKGIEIVDAIS